MRILLVLSLAFVLGACDITGPVGQQVDENFGYSPPNYAGVNYIYLDLNGDGKPDALAVGGKEQGSIAIDGSIPLPDGTLVPFTYSATDVKAFDGQAFRAELEKIVAQANADGIVAMTPELTGVLDSIVQSALKVASGGAL